MVRFQRLTGCRPQEVCLLRPCDVDRSADVWLYRPQTYKTEHRDRDRTIFIGPQAQVVLKKYLVRNQVTYCFCPIESEAARRAARCATRVTPLTCGNRGGSHRSPKPKRSPGERYNVASYRRTIDRATRIAFPHPTLSKLSASELSLEQNAELKKWQADNRWSPNQLRHSAATDVRRQFGLEAAQVMLGHSKADVTQVYAERDMAKGCEVARQIG